MSKFDYRKLSYRYSSQRVHYLPWYQNDETTGIPDGSLKIATTILFLRSVYPVIQILGRRCHFPYQSIQNSSFQHFEWFSDISGRSIWYIYIYSMEYFKRIRTLEWSNDNLQVMVKYCFLLLAKKHRMLSAIPSNKHYVTMLRNHWKRNILLIPFDYVENILAY